MLELNLGDGVEHSTLGATVFLHEMGIAGNSVLVDGVARLVICLDEDVLLSLAIHILHRFLPECDDTHHPVDFASVEKHLVL